MTDDDRFGSSLKVLIGFLVMLTLLSGVIGFLLGVLLVR